MSFQYLLMSNYQMYHKLLMKKLKGTGLSIGQPKILDYLYTHDGAKQAEIAVNCYIEPPSLTSAINIMEAKGMIERRRLGGDRRTYYIFLTDKGRILSERVEDAFNELEEEAFEYLTQSEQEEFVQMLGLLHERLSTLVMKREECEV